jgi:hypothetical protein
MVEAAGTAEPTVIGSSAKSLQPDEQNSADVELRAINQVVQALSLLAEEQRARALEYILRRFNFVAREATSSGAALQGAATFAPPPEQGSQTITPQGGAIQDIRTLKETKLPKSANEMAALVAFYVSELAPVGERRKEIGKADIERHFKTAGFRLPADASFTLVNAKNAGYLDSAGAGQYSLNPVGYNLVVHRMGNRDEDAKKTGTAGRRRPNARRVQPKKQSRTKK